MSTLSAPNHQKCQTAAADSWTASHLTHTAGSYALFFDLCARSSRSAAVTEWVPRELSVVAAAFGGPAGAET